VCACVLVCVYVVCVCVRVCVCVWCVCVSVGKETPAEKMALLKSAVYAPPQVGIRHRHEA
jgi:hypothetical protein